MAARIGLCLLIGLLGAPSAKAAEQQPNFLVFLADDLGWADAGFQGGAPKTPHLDRLAKKSRRLTRHYVQPMCSPTRAALLSGRYPSRFGVTGATNNRVFPFETHTLASALRSVGYVTGLIGKWHLGSDPDWGPHKFGFDVSYGSLAGGVGPYNHLYKKGPFSKTWHRGGKLIEDEGHTTDLIAREAVAFLDKHRDRPFFLYVPFTAPHHPLDEPKEWLERNAHIADAKDRLYAASITHMDDAIGRILAALEKTGRTDDTLILFFSDNGAALQPSVADTLRYPGSYPPFGKGSNGKLRGGKGSLYEGGLRVPTLLAWPGKLPAGDFPHPLHAVDWMPTFCRLAGFKAKTDLKWDGRDVWDALKTPDQVPPPRTLYWKGVGGRNAAVLQHPWKLIVQQGKKANVELFDLSADPGEQRNLAAEHPDRVQALRRALDQAAARDDDEVVRK